MSVVLTVLGVMEVIHSKTFCILLEFKFSIL